MNVRVRDKVPLKSVAPIADAMARVEANVAGHGRLLVRYSGTEPVLRVMLEGKDQEEIRRWGQEIVDVVKEHIG
jgi:phosphoglucosamine mutase